MIDVGGSNVKLMATGQEGVRKFRSGPRLTARQMVSKTMKAADGWEFEAVSLGFPGLVANGQPVREPLNLGKGWVGFDYEAAFKRPVRMINDAAMPGIAEINGVRHGSSPILIADAFGPLLTGDWERTPTGNTTARFAQARAQRIAWRSVERKAKSSNPKNTITVNVRFPQDLPAASDEAQVVGACVRGLEQAARKINANGRTTLTVYVYPDADRIASLTGQPGDGHGAAGIGEKQIFSRIDVFENIGERIAFSRQIGPAQRHSDQLRAARLQRGRHRFVR